MTDQTGNLQFLWRIKMNKREVKRAVNEAVDKLFENKYMAILSQNAPVEYLLERANEAIMVKDLDLAIGLITVAKLKRIKK